MDNEKLKPCPFCGGEAKVLGTKYEDGEYYIVCEKCRVRMGSYSNPEDAIAAWNKRNYPEKQDSPNELMDFVKFCRNASEGCIVYINNRARDLIAKHKECCKYAECKDGREINFPTIPKLSYTDIERMVKELKWSYIERKESLETVKYWESNMFFRFYQFKIKIQANNFKLLYLHNGDGHTIPIKFGDGNIPYYKSMAQEFLVDLVAAALGVERSGE